PEEISPAPSGDLSSTNNWLQYIIIEDETGTTLDLIPEFNPTIDQVYYTSVAPTNLTVNVAAVPISPRAIVRVGTYTAKTKDDEVVHNAIAATRYGDNYITIEVEAENGDIQTYTVVITRPRE
nr:cadherin-like beta sandwich domain-containing protein [Lachnospiraceae bacterium]